MPSLPSFQEVPLASIDLDDHPFHISPSQNFSPLLASLREVGLLNPPWLRGRPGEARWQVVAGLRRLRAAADLGWETVPARILPPDTGDDRCLLIFLYDNAFSRRFDLQEQAVLVTRLLAYGSREEVTSRYLPLLGLPPAPAFLDKLLKLAGLEEPFQNLAARGRLALTPAAHLARWDPADRTAVRPFLEQLPWTQSQQQELLEAVELLARREGAAIREILSQPELEQHLSSSSGSPPERTRSLRRRLHQRLTPRFAAAQEGFRAALARLGLRNHPRMRLEPPPAFEGPDFRLEIKFRDGAELHNLLEEMRHLAGREEFKAVAKVLNVE
jgi:ParB family chromosome partitioning protein